jgi:hypothetical protein
VFASRIAITSSKVLTPANIVVYGLAIVAATTPAAAVSSTVWSSEGAKEM